MNTEPMNPVSIEQSIRDTSTNIARGVKVCDERYREFLRTAHVLDVAFAQAFLDHDGPQYERRYAAELATQTQRRERDVADAAYRYADRTARALENELRALQSVNKSVMGMYGAAGTGVGA